MIFGYARVSTKDQSLLAQIETLKEAGAVRVIEETMTGADRDRPRLKYLMDRIGTEDVLIVTRLDRLARSTRDLLNILDRLGQQGASFKSLAEPWADTTTPHGRLMLAVIGGLAEFERELIRARTSEGRERAKAQGLHLGRKPKLTPFQIAEALKRRDAGEETLAQIGRSYNVSGWTIGRLARGRIKDGR